MVLIYTVFSLLMYSQTKIIKVIYGYSHLVLNNKSAFTFSNCKWRFPVITYQLKGKLFPSLTLYQPKQSVTFPRIFSISMCVLPSSVRENSNSDDAGIFCFATSLLFTTTFRGLDKFFKNRSESSSLLKNKIWFGRWVLSDEILLER